MKCVKTETLGKTKPQRYWQRLAEPRAGDGLGVSSLCIEHDQILYLDRCLSSHLCARLGAGERKRLFPLLASHLRRVLRLGAEGRKPHDSKNPHKRLHFWKTSAQEASSNGCWGNSHVIFQPPGTHSQDWSLALYRR